MICFQRFRKYQCVSKESLRNIELSTIRFIKSLKQTHILFLRIKKYTPTPTAAETASDKPTISQIIPIDSPFDAVSFINQSEQ